MSTRRLCLLVVFLTVFYGMYSSDSEEPQKDVLKPKKCSKRGPNDLESQHSTAVNRVPFSLLKEMEKNSWKEMHNDNISHNKIQYELHDLGTELQILLSKKPKALENSNFQAILNAIVRDYYRWESKYNFEKECGYGKVFFANNKYALYASGVTRKWIVFELNEKIWTQIFGNAEIYFKYWKKGWDIPRSLICDGSILITHSQLALQIKRFKEMTKIPSDKLKKYMRAAYYGREQGTEKKEFYGYYPVTNVCYENSSTKYRVSWKDGSKDILVFEDDLFEGELQVGHEVSVLFDGLNAEYVGHIKSIIEMSNTSKKYEIEWKPQVKNAIKLELMKNNGGPLQKHFQEDEIVAVRNKKKRRRESSEGEKKSRK